MTIQEQILKLFKKSLIPLELKNDLINLIPKMNEDELKKLLGILKIEEQKVDELILKANKVNQVKLLEDMRNLVKKLKHEYVIDLEKKEKNKEEELFSKLEEELL